MTFIPEQGMFQYTDWDEFKQVVLTKKQLTLNYLETDAFYDIRARDAERFRIVLQKGTDDADDFETNYKDDANIRYDVRMVIVDDNGNPLIDTVTGRVLVNGAIAWTSYATTEVTVDSPPNPPVPPASGGPWYHIGSDCAGPASRVIHHHWGSMS